MNHLAVITGTHRGLGHALAKHMLSTGRYMVWGISRYNEIEHPNFHFHQTDLSSSDAVDSLPDIPTHFHSYTLIHNAGILQPIAPAHRIQPTELQRIYQINILSAHLLSAWFIRQTLPVTASKHILHISSGAGRYPVTHWSAYCATKAALDMLSQCLALEYPQYRVYALAPGMVDTDMQSFIRSHTPDTFPEVQRYKSAKELNQLLDPLMVSNKIIHLIENSTTSLPVKISIKDL
jgi:benzil reductase ((S)-benzoin forming)